MTLIFIFYTFFSSLFNVDHQHLRDLFFQSEKSAKAAELFFNESKNISKSSKPILIGYRGMSEFMMSKYAGNVFSKLSHFSEGKDYLEHAIKMDPLNAELIFLRFSIQTNIPSFLGYNDNIDSDKKILFAFFKTNKANEDKDLKLKMAGFIIQSSYFSDSEKDQIRLLIKQQNG